MQPQPHMQSTPVRRARPFKLTRFFSVASLIGIVVVTVCLIWIDREHEVRSLIEHEGRANADLTRAFANTVWTRHRGFVLGSAGQSRATLLADPALPALRADVLDKMNGLQVVKIKIYNLDGLTVFSTEEKQIGEDKSANPGFRRAREGGVVSDITYREKFDAFEGTLSNRNLIFSYIPVRASPDAAPEGVFEVYSDVTDLLARQSRAQLEVTAIVVALLATLYLFLLLLVRKADRVMVRQEDERAAREEEVRHQAYHDSLTGLPNRSSFAERLGESIALAARHQHISALMFIDLDRFKIVNDSLGHHAGDLLLQAVSARMRACLRDGDLLFRMGGDEFTIILPEVKAPEDAAFVARRIREALANPIEIHEHALTVGATVGIAVYPGDGDTAETLLKNADAAMYAAKAGGRGRHAFYRADMNQRAMQRLGLEVALQDGFREGEFALYYQPRLDARTRRTVAVEALLRWVSPARGVVLPGDFIGVLEETGMMTIVGEWVLRSACNQVVRWRQEGLAPLRVSVNVSAVQFQSASFVSMVERVLSSTGVTPGLIELEMTESLLMRNAEKACVTINELKALGVRISIDDFGTGFSSLNYLRHFAVDYLKIDRSFVTEIAVNKRDRAVATAITDLAKALDITVVAEGVETEAQAEFLHDIECGELQGFLFCKPLPVEALLRYLAGTSKHPPERAAAVGHGALVNLGQG